MSIFIITIFYLLFFSGAKSSHTHKRISTMSNYKTPVIGLKQVKDLTFPLGLHGHS